VGKNKRTIKSICVISLKRLTLRILLLCSKTFTAASKTNLNMDNLEFIDNIEGLTFFGLANGKQSLLLFQIIISQISKKQSATFEVDYDFKTY
jgi:hypothetical protein